MPEVIVLDTHVWLWLVNGNFESIPNHWLAEIESANQVGVCSISCYEIALAHSRGRIERPGTTEEWFESAFDPVGVELIPLTSQIASRAVSLSPVHKDPFDRLIIATTLTYEAVLASADGLIFRYPELVNCIMKRMVE